MAHFDDRLDAILRDAARAGKYGGRNAYWNARIQGLDALASSILGQQPIPLMKRGMPTDPHTWALFGLNDDGTEADIMD